MNIIADVFNPCWRKPMPEDLQEMIGGLMAETAPKAKPTQQRRKAPDRGFERRRELSPRVLEMHRHGKSLAVIALAVGCARNTVIRILQDAALEGRA